MGGKGRLTSWQRSEGGKSLTVQRGGVVEQGRGRAVEVSECQACKASLRSSPEEGQGLEQVQSSCHVGWPTS